jgi:hypothetical protein
MLIMCGMCGANNRFNFATDSPLTWAVISPQLCFYPQLLTGRNARRLRLRVTHCVAASILERVAAVGVSLHATTVSLSLSLSPSLMMILVSTVDLSVRATTVSLSLSVSLVMVLVSTVSLSLRTTAVSHTLCLL